ncbi:hypothetical protein LJR290_006829 [Variovorax sp. LjRoot290]|uniref:hypothetical protein n=1 Tax=Variovorax sp. LjRoot290 TaxID=3342316 RepID=UPI003ECEC862
MSLCRFETIHSRTLLLAASLMLLSQPGWAGRPFTTEDAGVIADGACELESFGAYVRPRHEPSERGGWSQVGCGIGFDTQLAVGAGRFKSGGGSNTVAALGGKTALRPLSDDSVGVTLAYVLEGLRSSGQHMRHAGSAAALVVSIPNGRTIVHANLGVARNHLEGKTVGTYALAVERLGERGLDVGLEVFGQGSERPWIGTGARYALRAEKLFVDFSFAVQTGDAHARKLTVGLKYAF